MSKARPREISCPDCGAVFSAAAPTRRSTPQHRRFFGVIKAAFHHWPEADEFRPRNVEHLRYWLEKEAGYFTIVKTINCQSVEPSQLVAVLTAVFSGAEDDRLFVEVEGSHVSVLKVKSISYDELEHLDACRLFDAVEGVLRARGIDPDQLLAETEAAA